MNINESIEDIKLHQPIREVYVKKNHPELYSYINDMKAPLDNKGNIMPFKQRIYHIINNDEAFQLGRCPICGKRVRFRDGKYAAVYCSNQCIGKSENVRKLRSEVLRSESVREKRKSTCITRYGCDHQSKSPIIRQKLSEAQQSESTRSKFKQTCLDRYGVEAPAQNEDVKKKLIASQRSDETKSKREETNINRYRVPYSSQDVNIRAKLATAQQSEVTKSKKRNTVITKYGVTNISQLDDIKVKISEVHLSEKTKEKTKNTCIAKYGTEWASQNVEIRKKISDINSSEDVLDKSRSTCLKKYGVDYVLRSPEILSKAIDTKRKHNTFNTSSIEESIAEMLDADGIKYVRQYKSESYPFSCDFYITEYQLYVEINASWTHGKKPYNPADPSCQDILSQWKEKAKHSKYYKNAIKVWTVRDVKKRETALMNKIKYLEIFTNNKDEAYKAIKESIHA